MRRTFRKALTGSSDRRVRDHIYAKMLEAEETPSVVKVLDKLAFTFGVLNLVAVAYFLQAGKGEFAFWYSFIMPLLLLARVYHFRSLNWHYFLFDFCYFTVMLTFVGLLGAFALTSTSSSSASDCCPSLFFRVCFVLSVGPLPIAIILWRNR